MQGDPGESRRSPSGREGSRIREARLRPSRYELLAHDDVWAELERRGATMACVDVESAATGVGETAITAMETFESEMAVIAISDGDVYVELPTFVPDHEGFVMVGLAIARFCLR